MYSKVPLEKNPLAKMKVPLLVAFSYTRKNIGKLYWKQISATYHDQKVLKYKIIFYVGNLS